MAGGDNRNRIAIIGHADGTKRFRTTDRSSQLFVGSRLAVGNAAEGGPNTLLEGGAVLVKGEVEVVTLTGEVFGELRGSLLQQRCFLFGGIGREGKGIAGDEVDRGDAAATGDDE